MTHTQFLKPIYRPNYFMNGESFSDIKQPFIPDSSGRGAAFGAAYQKKNSPQNSVLQPKWAILAA